MKTRVIILAGGAGTRLGVLTAKRTKPATPFAGKYRIIDFPLSNCVNSGLSDVMIVAQYLPRSLIEHIGSGSPWDLNRDFTGGVRIYTPFTRRRNTDWFSGTADAVQQNFSWIKSGSPEFVLILSGDHIYEMDYEKMIQFHQDRHADVTIASIRVTREEASRFGILDTDPNYRVTSFVEKPENPPSTLANMGVYLFNTEVLDRALWDDYNRDDTSHDFGKDIIPSLLKEYRVFSYPFSGYWVDVGTVTSYWQAHMDLLKPNPPMNLYDRSWVIHTRSEERPPSLIHPGASVENSMICNGCVIEAGAVVRKSILSPGVRVRSGAVIEESILLTDCVIQENAVIKHAILDKRVHVGRNTHVGDMVEGTPKITMIGKNSLLPSDVVVEAGAQIGTDVTPTDLTSDIVTAKQFVQTRRLPYEI
ncbi:MAG: glucose-1-phosphate adenylyltransferase [Anaerolineaceae bacterium]|nr:glucose-1-phosphate adenylyltransferase [Anaerolineaceae bacterium]